jgi:ADP-ribose pyrophosphatase
MSYKLVEKQVIFDGKKVRLEVHHLDNEETGKRHKQEIVVHGGAVVILPFVDAETILLIRNRRYAIQQYLLELPAGTIDKGEPPMNTAGRELKEETGYLAGRLQLLGSFFSSPGILTEKIHAFVAYDLEKSTTALEEGEDIELMPTKYADAIEMIKDGQINDGKTINALLLYDRFHRERKEAQP